MTLRPHLQLGLSLMIAVVGACATPAPASEQAAAAFGPGERVGELRGKELREVSGLVASARHPGLFWVHNDSGDEARLFAVDSTGRRLAVLRLTGAANRDWEDIARRGDTLFIAEIGDNSGVHPYVEIYAVLEPDQLGEVTLPPIARHRLRYPDGPRDAETLLVDPLTGDWFIVTKRDRRSRVYRAAAPHAADSLRTLERIPGELTFRGAVGGDVSPDGREVLVKRYEAVYYWRRSGEESLAATLLRTPQRLPYKEEPQGEAIGFTLDAGAYFTTTERSSGKRQPMLRYARRSP